VLGAVITQRNMPLREMSLDGIRALGVGASMTCALDATGTLKCAGSNDQGQFGNGQAAGRLRRHHVQQRRDVRHVPRRLRAGTAHADAAQVRGLAVSSTRSFACGLAGDSSSAGGPTTAARPARSTSAPTR
jgi:hypothetical protein